ncbi:YdcF family protein [Eubacteriales bacterium OttesenSCG-928-N14]|nr:YdcF family protein [Eubacteriales bacterium OttesenSCG-928-N14]
MKGFTLPKPVRITVIVIGVLAALVVIVYGTVFALVLTKEGEQTEVSPADCIIVLGAKVGSRGPTLSLRTRLDVGLQYYKEGLAPKIIVTGAQGADEPTTEAAAAREYLLSHGVPSEDIFVEDTSTNTLENLQNSKRIMEANGLDTAIICTSDYHAYRANIQARDVGISVNGIGKARLDLANKWVFRARETLSIIKYFMGV